MAIGLITLLFMGCFALLLLALQDYVLERRDIYRSLRTVREIEVAPTDIRTRELARPLPTRILIPGIRKLGGVVRRFTPAGAIERLSRWLAYAGSPPGWDAERLLAFKFIGAPVLGVGYLLLALIGETRPLRTVVLTIAFTALGYYLPDLIVHSQYSKRQDLIQRALADSLDLLSITVEAGLGFDAAVSRVARHTGGPLGEELHRVVQEMQLGKPRSDALRELGERSTVPELKSFVLAMVQADIFGISVARVLHVQAQEMRIKRRQRAEERAQKIPVKIVFPLLFCIFPALFVVLLGPAAIRIYDALF